MLRRHPEEARPCQPVPCQAGSLHHLAASKTSSSSSYPQITYDLLAIRPMSPHTARVHPHVFVARMQCRAAGSQAARTPMLQRRALAPLPSSRTPRPPPGTGIEAGQTPTPPRYRYAHPAQSAAHKRQHTDAQSDGGRGIASPQHIEEPLFYTCGIYNPLVALEEPLSTSRRRGAPRRRCVPGSPRSLRREMASAQRRPPRPSRAALAPAFASPS